MGDSVEGQPAIKIFLYNLLKKNICLLVCCKGPDKKKYDQFIASFTDVGFKIDILSVDALTRNQTSVDTVLFCLTYRNCCCKEKQHEGEKK